jgi:hypothetical protein
MISKLSRTGSAVLLAALLPFLTLAPTPADAQTITTVSRALTADDADVALLIQRTDTTPGYVTVSAAGDITLEQTDTSTVDNNIECDAAIAADGARSGIIDVSVAACDTLAEVCDIINSQGDNEWACVILDGLPTDTPGPAGTGFILAASDQDASRSVTGGYGVKWDTSAVWTSTIALLPPEARRIEAYYYPTSTFNKVFYSQPWLLNGRQTYWLYSNATSTYATGTSFYNVYSVALSFPSGNADNDGTMTVTGPYYRLAGGATTVNKEFSTFATHGLPVPIGEKLVLRLTNSEVMTTTTHIAIGKVQ